MLFLCLPHNASSARLLGGGGRGTDITATVVFKACDLSREDSTRLHLSIGANTCATCSAQTRVSGEQKRVPQKHSI